MPEQPITAKGQRTRVALIDAARVVFERDGYLDARITDIAEEANVAHGTFYTYFTGKEDIIGEVYDRFRCEVVPTGARDPSATTPEQAIEHANRQFLEVARRSARLIEVFNEALVAHPHLWERRAATRGIFICRVRRHLESLRADGLIDPDIDLDYSAEALCCMVERFAHVWFIRDLDYEMDRAVATLTRLWTQAIGLRSSCGATVSVGSPN